MPENDFTHEYGEAPLVSLEALPIDQLLEELVLRNASDIHLRVGEPPAYRVFGELTRSELTPLSADELKKLLYAVMNEERRERFERTCELDMSYAIQGVARFRISVFRQRGEIGAVLRVIPLKLKSIDDWGLPQIIKQFATLPRGLILVTGPTGSGKSTTLSAMVDYINESRRSHIITIEDPLEYVHHDKQSVVEQREIGVDTRSFASALAHVMRQNPDVIMVGELRDHETMSLAMSAAETGHLVLSTLHTMDASQTVGRIIDAFSPEEQTQVRLQLSTVLQGVVSQTLLRRTDGPGLVAAFEIMTCTPAIKSLIREGKTPQIYSLIQTGSRVEELQRQGLADGMRSLRQDGIEKVLMGVTSIAEVRAMSNA